MLKNHWRENFQGIIWFKYNTIILKMKYLLHVFHKILFGILSRIALEIFSVVIFKNLFLQHLSGSVG